MYVYCSRCGDINLFTYSHFADKMQVPISLHFMVKTGFRVRIRLGLGYI